MPLDLTFTIQVRALADNSGNYQNSFWSAAQTLTRTATPTPAPTDPPTNTPTFTPVPTDTPTNTPIPTDTPTNTPVPTDTPTNTPVPPTPTPVPLELPAPGNLRQVSGFTVAWDAVTGAIGYRLTWFVGSQDLPASATQFTIGGLWVGEVYGVRVRALGDGILYEKEGDWSAELRLALYPTATPTPIPTNTPAPTDTPTATATYSPTPIPTPGPVKKLRSGGVFTDAFGVDWEKPTVGVNQSTVYRVEYMDPWSDDWNYAGTTDKLSYYKNEPGWSGEFGIRVRAEGNNGTGPWSRISVSVA